MKYTRLMIVFIVLSVVLFLLLSIFLISAYNKEKAISDVSLYIFKSYPIESQGIIKIFGG